MAQSKQHIRGTKVPFKPQVSKKGTARNHLWLSFAKKALIDPEDWEGLRGFRWHSGGNGPWAEMTFASGEKRKVLLTHALLGGGRKIYHLNGDLNDCRKGNLSFVPPYAGKEMEVKGSWDNVDWFEAPVSWPPKEEG